MFNSVWRVLRKEPNSKSTTNTGCYICVCSPSYEVCYERASALIIPDLYELKLVEFVSTSRKVTDRDEVNE